MAYEDDMVIGPIFSGPEFRPAPPEVVVKWKLNKLIDRTVEDMPSTYTDSVGGTEEMREMICCIAAEWFKNKDSQVLNPTTHKWLQDKQPFEFWDVSDVREWLSKEFGWSAAIVNNIVMDGWMFTNFSSEEIEEELAGEIEVDHIKAIVEAVDTMRLTTLWHRVRIACGKDAP
jgi:hypothetical protein